ncbi:hypothetical protein [Aeromonas diversa]|uniref:LafX n=1 Tax=Aeromonas diversa CDC 2478-85 TaxID=1268237 RepID=N9TZA6_9GAMM|nr:hypothetical protein [Aeromonas diversa]ENY71395.1 LafX [Aeromonas diversa CDC 2478-85]
MLPSQQESARQLLLVASRLLDQARAGQWQEVTRLDAALANACAQLRRAPALWQALASTREEVRRLHAEALVLCRSETARLQLEWQSLGEQHEGIRAYEEVASR